MVPDAPKLRLQQAWPALPQGMHVVPEQVVPLPVHTLFGQQVCPTAPQPPHEPAEQVPAADPQALLTPTQVGAWKLKPSLTQQLPSVQLLPPQQGTRPPTGLAVPHFTQRASPLPLTQTVSALLHRLAPGQHSSPGPPQVWQMPPVTELPPRHDRPAVVQRWPGQQGALGPPHCLQVPGVAKPPLKSPPLQALSASVQRMSTLLLAWGQQDSPMRPQPQRPAWHIPKLVFEMVQESPAA
jgi:hypothetical protein